MKTLHDTPATNFDAKTSACQLGGGSGPEAPGSASHRRTFPVVVAPRIQRFVIATISAALVSCGGGSSNSEPPPPAGPQIQSISISPAAISTGVDIARSLTAVATYTDGSQQDITATASWTVTDAAVATVVAGVVSGRAIGSTQVTATAGSAVGTVSATVTPNNTWTAVPTPFSLTLGTTLTLLPNGDVLLAGGVGCGGVISPKSAVYRVAQNAWVDVPSQSCSDQTATLLPTGKVLLAGGYWLGGSYNSGASLYDPASNKIVDSSRMSVPRTCHVATLLADGNVLMTGGCHSGSGQYGVELYHTATNTWSPVHPMMTWREGHSATLLPNGTVLVAGGRDAITDKPLSSAEIYDPVTDTWTAAPDMPVASSGQPPLSPSSLQRGLLLPNGKVLVVGRGAAQLYDPVNRSWALAGSMIYPRVANLVLLPNGNVLAAGGWDGSNYLSSAEVYNPASNSWSLAGTMTDTGFPNAVKLAGGVVLACGLQAAGYCDLYW